VIHVYVAAYIAVVNLGNPAGHLTVLAAVAVIATAGRATLSARAAP
jgi:hypothetical protein